jgi:putative flippase GtrA
MSDPAAGEHPSAVLFARWLRFNSVGAAGVAVQLGCLALFVEGLELHYLPSALLAVEAAVLHNFCWHQRWTWRDRPSRTAADALLRLTQFHLTNGLVSLAGNAAVSVLLTGGLGVHPVAAGTVAIVACSLVNFFASERLVFRAASALVVAAAMLASEAPLQARNGPADPPPHAASAWRAYALQVDERYRRVTAASVPFFAHDEFAGAGWRAAARNGGVSMLEIASAIPGGVEPSIPDGRVHHWAGAVFVPGVTVEDVVKTLEREAGREASTYEDVVASRLIERTGDRFRVFLKLRRSSIVTVTYNTEHSVEYRRLGGGRATSRAVATRIAEVADPGTPAEREKGPGEDHGFLWRLNAYWRYEQADGGVYLECESVSLSRSVPLLARPFVNGVVERIARESLRRTLLSLRRVLTS